MQERVYVSITGLKVRSVFQILLFYRHAVASMAQARQAPGNISAEARTINGVRHTLSVWESETAMRKFLYCGAHRNAIKAFPSIGSGKTFGYDADTIPTWEEVHLLWLEKARGYEAEQADHSGNFA
ncbi:MAG: hypothetical protein AAGE89_14640 [Pseudomonadota bacterium]